MNVYAIDLFCGAGGMSTGLRDAGVKVVACVNHDEGAIKAHKSQHPEALHFPEDIRDGKVIEELGRIANKIRREDPNAFIILHASLECTNFSIAKGGLSRDADSRSLAEFMPLYIEAIKPDNFSVENVKEFKLWGPLIPQVKECNPKQSINYPHCPLHVFKEKKKVIGFGPTMVPDKTRLSIYFNDWVASINKLGYQYEDKLINAADHGSCQNRIRYFAQFVRHGLDFCFPEPTHHKTGANGLQKHVAVRTVLDFENKGESILSRKRKLVEATEKRVLAGLYAHVGGGKEVSKSFIAKYYSGRPEGKVISINGPAGTVRTTDGQALVQTEFLAKTYGVSSKSSGIYSVDKAASTLTTKDGIHVVSAAFLTKYMGNNVKTGSNSGISIDKPCNTIATSNRQGLVQCAFVNNYYGNGTNDSVEKTTGTLRTKGMKALVQLSFIDCQFSEGQTSRSIDKTCGTLTTTPKYNLVSAFIYDTQYNNLPASVDAPSRTIIARMDKKPPCLVQIETGELAILIHPDDSPTMIEIKKFMAAYGVVDIYMRMLTEKELLRIQSMPDDYFDKVFLTMTQKKKYIGNAVDRSVAFAIGRAFMLRYSQQQQAQTA